MNLLEHTATDIERRVRAFEVFPKTRVELAQGLVIITAARVVAEIAPKSLTVHCKTKHSSKSRS